MPQPRKRRPAPSINPLDYVVLTRERLQDVFDDAVERGRMTRSDATDLVAELMRRGRGVTEEVVSDVEQLLGRSRESLEEVAVGAGRRARRAVGLGPNFPIDAYDDLSVAQVREQLDGLTPAELRKVRDHERRNANRKTVLQAIEAKLS